MKAIIKVERITEFQGEFEGDSIEEIITQARFESRASGELIAEKVEVLETNRVISYTSSAPDTGQASLELSSSLPFPLSFPPSDQRS